MFFCLVGVLPVLNPSAGFSGRIFKVLKIGRSKACAGVPFVLVVLVAKLEGRRSECAFDAAVFPYADVNAAIGKFINWLLACFV